jgi:hypothetical protein
MTRHRHRGIAGVLAFALLGVACTSTAADEADCPRADTDVVDTIETKLTVDGTLRNATVREIGSGVTVITAELHESDDRADKEGKILTWVTDDVSSDDFSSVDTYARDRSSWPAADFDVRRDGVIESRACTALWLGDE